ncbi:MAG: carboxypeptidase-like regulatory domain-containing protein, partial [Vicinamibacterales bacterium]
PVATLIRVELAAPGSIAPGESVQLTATAVKSDNSVENVTALAQWTSSDRAVLEISSTGVAKTIARGEAVVTARYLFRSATTRTFVLPAGTYRLNGTVTDSGVGIAGVTVTVIGNVGEELTTITDGQGMYVLYGVRDRVRLQAKAPGYHNRIEEIDVADHRTFNFGIVPERQRTDLRGNYTLTIARTACPGSPLPETRSYDAAVAQDGARLTVTLSGADFIITGGRSNAFSGVIDAGDRLTFTIGDAEDGYYYYGRQLLVERFSATRVLIINGKVTAVLSPTGISGTLDGNLLLAIGTNAQFFQVQATCRGTAHGFEMIRR